MPASYVKPYVKRQKNDATDAEAICEALTRPTMRFVRVKSEEQQSVLMLHRVRELLIRQRTMLVNALRGHLAEFGIVTRQGIAGVGMLVEDDDPDLTPPLARSALLSLIGQLREVHEKVSEMDRQIHAWHRSNGLSRRLETIPGIGSITASAIAATVTDGSLFKSGRQSATWIGLVPRQNSSGGKDRLGRISKQGDPYLRRLLVVEAHAVLRFSRKTIVAPTRWAAELLAKKPYNVVAVALGNKMARIVRTLMTTGMGGGDAADCGAMDAKEPADIGRGAPDRQLSQAATDKSSGDLDASATRVGACVQTRPEALRRPFSHLIDFRTRNENSNPLPRSANFAYGWSGWDVCPK